MSHYKFDKYGRAYRVAKLEEGQLLAYEQMGHDECGEMWDGNVHVMMDMELYDTPPGQRIDKEIADKQAQLEELRTKLLATKKELVKEEKDVADRFAKLKKLKPLEHIEEFVDGKITHYVEAGYGPPEIIPLEDTRPDIRESRNEFKLLTLFGRSGGHLDWNLNHYGDGSGTNTNVIPCASYEQALDITKKLFWEHQENALDVIFNTNPSLEWIKAGATYGIPMSEEYVWTAVRLKKEKTMVNINRHNDKIAALKKELGLDPA